MTFSFIKAYGNNSYTLDITVQPNSRKTECVGIYDHRLKLKISSPPIEGKANQELIKFFNKHFSISKSQLELVKGEHSRQKQLLFKSIGLEELNKQVGKLL